MVVGLCTVELYLPNGHSLKDKRRILSSVKTRVCQKFNVSLAEVGEQDLWQKAVLGIACVANEAGYVSSVLQQVVNVIRANPALELLDSRIELL